MKIVSHFLFILSLIIIVVIQHYDAKIAIELIMTDGSKVYKYYPESTEYISLSALYESGYRIKSVQGLEKLKNLKTLSYGPKLHDIENCDFLKPLTTLENLYLPYARIDDFSILSEMKNLKELNFQGYITKEGIEKIKKNGLDFTFCPKLEKLTLDPLSEKFYFIPDIKISSKKTELFMSEQNIKTVSKEEAVLTRFIRVRLPKNVIRRMEKD